MAPRKFLNNDWATAVELGDRLRTEGDLEGAAKAYLEGARHTEPVPASLCLALARTYLRLDNIPEATRWAMSVVDAGDDFSSWLAAATLIQTAMSWKIEKPRCRARVAIIGSFTTLQLSSILPLAALRQGIELQVWEAPFGQYRQELLDPASALYRGQPDFIVLAVHEGDLQLPFLSERPVDEVAEEIARWKGLWRAATLHSSARVIQFNFALPAEAPLGHLGARFPGSRYAMTLAVNSGLGAAANGKVDILDCERLSARIGKALWMDPRYWHLSKQAVSLQALPLLARHLTAIIAANLGLARKCLVLDLDNTLWGGVIGEDRLTGIKLGGDHVGESFVAFQEAIRLLKQKGVVLAVCSKNNEADAREPFERHPEMRLKLDDFAVFTANWEPKPDNLRRIAQSLNIGLDALVFVDDNPAECAAVRQALPEVDVLSLPTDPSCYVRTLFDYLGFEILSLTAEDAMRTDHYRARATVTKLEQSLESVEELWRSLDMQATISPFNEIDLPRIAQLIGKTNQFNLTTRRYNQAQIEAFVHDPGCIHFTLRLRDRFADHGLVSLMIALQRGHRLEIDTWLMSCRVIGRSVENTMFEHLCECARQQGITTIRGFYIATARNQLVQDLFSQLGFERVEAADGTEAWDYDLAAASPIANRFIQTTKGIDNGYSAALGARV